MIRLFVNIKLKNEKPYICIPLKRQRFCKYTIQRKFRALFKRLVPNILFVRKPQKCCNFYILTNTLNRE